MSELKNSRGEANVYFVDAARLGLHVVQAWWSRAGLLIHAYGTYHPASVPARCTACRSFRRKAAMQFLFLCCFGVQTRHIYILVVHLILQRCARFIAGSFLLERCVLLHAGTLCRVCAACERKVRLARRACAVTGVFELKGACP